MKTILIILLIVLIGYILVKVVFPIMFKLLGLILAVLIPAIIIGLIIVTLFIGGAAFVGMTRSADEDGGTSIAEEFEQVEDINKRIEDKIDSLEGGKIDMWIKKKQKAYNEKHP